MTTTAAVRRPGLVTVLVVLVVLAGIGQVLAGIVAFTASGVIAAGLIGIVLGLVYLGVAKGLLDGRNWARMVAAVVAAVQVLFAILTVFNTDSGAIRSSAIGNAIVGIIVLAILFSPRANAFFRAHSS